MNWWNLLFEMNRCMRCDSDSRTIMMLRSSNWRFHRSNILIKTISLLQICDDTVNTETFERAIFVGLVFCSMYLVVGILVDYVGKKAILMFVLGGAGVCGIAAHLVNNQITAVALFAVFQMSGACIGLLTAVVVDLFPTRLRLVYSQSFVLSRYNVLKIYVNNSPLPVNKIVFKIVYLIKNMLLKMLHVQVLSR